MAKIIYAPMRNKYFDEKRKNSHNKEECIFCNYKKQKELVVLEGNTAIIMANKFPYNFGHLMVIPKRHVENIEDLNKDEDKDVMLLIKRAVKFLKTAFNPIGFNIGLNIGNNSGRSIKHLHFHIIPRYDGDTGFMDIIGKTKILSKTPQEMVKELKSKI